MSYGNQFSNKPFERAGKTAHTNFIIDKDVKSFLSRCDLPPLSEESDKNDFNIQTFVDIEKKPIKNIISIDGGYTNVCVRENFPSSTIAFFQFGALFFKRRDLVELKEKPFIDPEDISKL